GLGWFAVMKQVDLSTLGVFYAVSTSLALTAVGIFVFKENVNATEGLGIAMALSSLFLLARFA
ncbi:MAG: transporter, partial [Patescibacteria group bacterium]